MTHDNNIPFDLENTPLEIKTGLVKTGTQIAIEFRIATGSGAGGIVIEFGVSPAKYRIVHCSAQGSWTPFNQVLPTSVGKVWRFTKAKSVQGNGFMIHCNGMKLLDIVFSASTCSSNDWNTRWNRVVTKMILSSRYDRASDFYRPYQRYRPGNWYYLYNLSRALRALEWPCPLSSGAHASALILAFMTLGLSGD